MALREDLGHRRPASAARRLAAASRIGIRLSIAGIALALVMRVPLAVLGNTRHLARGGPVLGGPAVRRRRLHPRDQPWAWRCCPGSPTSLTKTSPAPGALLHRVLIAFTAAGAVLAAVALPLAEPIMHAIFGSDFSAGADLLRIVLAGMPAYAALGICWYSAIALEGEGRLLGIGLLGLAVCVALSVLLIPTDGDAGAAWSYVASLYAMAGLSFLVLDASWAGPPPQRSTASARPSAGGSGCPAARLAGLPAAARTLRRAAPGARRRPARRA